MSKNNLLKGACLVAAASILTPLQTAKAGLSISGWINEAMTYWDDGQGSSVNQISDNGTTLGSRITFAGSQDLLEGDLNAGFEVILEPQSNVTALLSSNQDNIRTLNGGDIGALGHSLFVGGRWGKVTVGLQSMPTDNIAVLGDPSLTLWSGISPVFRFNGFFIRGLGAGAANTTWGDFLQCLTVPGLGIGLDCNGIYRNGFRYDLPAFGPVSIAAGYANTDIYDIAAKYTDTLGGRFKTILNLGYARNSMGGTNATTNVDANGNGVGTSSQVFQVQGGLLDSDTGLFGTVAYQKEKADDAIPGAAGGIGDDTDAIYLKFGIKKNWFGIGDTAVYFEYGSYNDQFGSGATATVANPGITGSEVRRLGASIDQRFGGDLLIYGKFENLNLDVEGNAATRAIYDGADDLNSFTVGFAYFF